MSKFQTLEESHELEKLLLQISDEVRNDHILRHSANGSVDVEKLLMQIPTEDGNGQIPQHSANGSVNLEKLLMQIPTEDENSPSPQHCANASGVVSRNAQRPLAALDNDSQTNLQHSVAAHELFANERYPMGNGYNSSESMNYFDAEALLRELDQAGNDSPKSGHASHCVQGSPVGPANAANANAPPFEGSYSEELDDLIGFESSSNIGENSNGMVLNSDEYTDDDDFNSEGSSVSDQESRTGPSPNSSKGSHGD